MRFNGIFLTSIKTVALLIKESERCEFGPCPDVVCENGREHLTQRLGLEEFYAIELADSEKRSAASSARVWILKRENMNREKMIDSIESERLVLFPYTKENLALFNADLAAFEREYGVKYRGEELDYLLAGFLKKLEREIAEDPEHYLFFTEFLIVEKGSDQIIGSIDFKYIPRDGVTEVGYGLNPSFEGHGFMTEALTAFLHFGKTLGIKTVLADTLPDNVRSQNVLKRCGFHFLRQEDNLWWEKNLS